VATDELRFPWFRAYRRQLMLAIVPLALAAVLLQRPWPISGATDLFFDLAGFAAIALGATIRLLAANEICDRKKVTLVRSGIYASTRNPLYLGNFLAGIGLAMVGESLTLLLLVLLVYAPVYFVVTLHEERRLLGLHGDPYAAYFDEVPRFFPRLADVRKWKPTVSWDARLFRREVPNMLGIFAAALLIEGIDMMHEVLGLPSFFP